MEVLGKEDSRAGKGRKYFDDAQYKCKMKGCRLKKA